MRAHFAEGSSTFRGHSPYCPKAQPTLHVLSILASSAPRPNQQHLVRRQLEITTASCETQVQGLWNYAEFEGPPCRIVYEILVFENIYTLCGGIGIASSWRIQRDVVSKTKSRQYLPRFTCTLRQNEDGGAEEVEPRTVALFFHSELCICSAKWFACIRQGTVE